MDKPNINKPIPEEYEHLDGGRELNSAMTAVVVVLIAGMLTLAAALYFIF